MLHEPAPQFDRIPSPELDAEGHPILDASAYIDAMRAGGAKLVPIRGQPGDVELNGTFAVVQPTGKSARRRVAAIEAEFAPRRAADSHADGRIAQALFDEAASQRFAALVGDDFAAALLEFARLDDATAAAYERQLSSDSLASDDPARIEALSGVDIAIEQHQLALDYAMAMPIKTTADVGLKAQFAVRFGETEEQWLQVLQDIAGFFEAKTNPSDPPTIAPTPDNVDADPIISIRDRAQALRADAASRTLDDPEADDIVDRYLEIEQEAISARPMCFAGAIVALEWAGDELRTDEPDAELVQALIAGASQHFRDAARPAASSAPHGDVVAA